MSNLSEFFSNWRRLWWVAAFCAVACFIYLEAMQEKKAAVRELSFRLQEMEKSRTIAYLEKEDLLLRIDSQNDLAWIETILMRDLGVVPEGYIKVHFRKSDS